MARSTPELLSIEAWGGATYDVALRFLHEDPWDRLAALREAIPNVCLQMLLRGRNTVGYTPYPSIVGTMFVREAAKTGVDIFRIFDALNDIEQMRPAIDAVLETGSTVAEVALCYTGDLADPAESLYDLDYYLRLADQIVRAGAHALAIKDMAGLLRPPAAATLVRALRARFDLPVHVHTHDTAGGQMASLFAAWQAGADAVDGASAPLAGTTSQPPISAIVAATDHTERETGLNLNSVCDLEPYWQAVREIYAPFESGIQSPTGRVFSHEIPGGQLSNLRQQAIALGLGQHFEGIEHAYAAVDRLLGRVVKVTPSSKVVGDLALQIVGSGIGIEELAADPARFDLPDSVIGFLRGELGDPPGGWPEPFRTRALHGRPPAAPKRPLNDAELTALKDDTRGTLNRLLFPGPTSEFVLHREQFGDTSILDSLDFFYGLQRDIETAVDLDPGVRLLMAVTSVSEPDERGLRTVMCTLNGQLRPISIRDRSVTVDVDTPEKANRADPSHIAAPFSGTVTLTVSEGNAVIAGQAVAKIEAMKMEAGIATPHSGTVTRVAIGAAQQVEGGDLLLIVTAVAESDEHWLGHGAAAPEQ
jgi:pyruvate carboxylase